MRRRTAQRGRCKRPRQDEEIAPAEPFRGSSSSGDDADIERQKTWTSDSFSTIAEAAMDMREEVRRGIGACQMIEQAVESLLKQREMSRAAVDTITSSQCIHPNETVRFNVGDEIFTVPLHLLLNKDGSKNYFDMLLESVGKDSSDGGLVPPLLDDSGAIFVNRDPGTFRLVLNYLRGYKFLNLLNEDQLSMLKADARYYQLSGLMDLLGDHTQQDKIRFRSGPGVNPERSRLRVVYGVSVVGQRFLITGRHRITFQVTNSDYVGIGLVSDSCVSTDQEFHKTAHCCVYYMTGVFYSNFPHHRKEDGLEALEKNDYVSLMVDMNKRVAEYTLKNTTKTISLGNARKLRFAVTMKMGSSVRIVPECEAQQLPLFKNNRDIQTQTLVSHVSTGTDDRDTFTQLSQPNGAGTVAPAIPGPFPTLTTQQQQQQQQQQIAMAPLTFFRPRVMEGTARGNSPPMGLPLDMRRRSLVIGSIANGPLLNEMDETDPILFVSGTHERREGE